MHNNALILADAAIRSLADDADLSDSLLTIFARILSRQVTVNTETEEVEYGAAFDKLLSVFTFVAIRQDERQGSPSDFGGRVEEAKEKAQAAIFGPPDDSDPTDPIDLEAFLIEAGAVGEPITLQAEIAHTGEPVTLVFELAQGQQSIQETLNFNQDSAGIDIQEWTLSNTSGLEPGAVEATLTITDENGSIRTEKTFGLYQDRQSSGFDWSWADPTLSPFNLIGQVMAADVGDHFSLGTGFMISPRHVMTNAHVVDTGLEGDRDDIEFFLGRNGGSLLATQESNAYTGISVDYQDSAWDSDRFLEGDGWPDTDMAIITLSEEIALPDEGPGRFDWFWNARETPRDLSGMPVTSSGYPSGGIEQGLAADGFNDAYFQWQWQAHIDDYRSGYDDFGGDSGGLLLTDGPSSARGASGSPVWITPEDEDRPAFIGAYAGRFDFGGGVQQGAIATLDPAAYEWARQSVQADGYLLDLPSYIEPTGLLM